MTKKIYEASDNATSEVPCDAPVDSSNSIEQVVKFLRKKIATNSRKWDRAQTTSDKIKFGGKARMCREILDYVLSIDQEVKVSDTTEADSSNADDKTKNLS